MHAADGFAAADAHVRVLRFMLEQASIIKVIIGWFILVLVGLICYIGYSMYSYSDWCDGLISKVRLGMTMAEIEKVIGPPASTGTWSGSYGEGTMWNYYPGGKASMWDNQEVILTFIDSSLIEVGRRYYFSSGTVRVVLSNR